MYTLREPHCTGFIVAVLKSNVLTAARIALSEAVKAASRTYGTTLFGHLDEESPFRILRGPLSKHGVIMFVYQS